MMFSRFRGHVADETSQAINKLPPRVEIDETVPIGKFAVAFSLVDERLVCNKGSHNSTAVISIIRLFAPPCYEFELHLCPAPDAL